MTAAGAHYWSPYCGVAPVPGELLSRWNLDPVLLAFFTATAGWWLVAGRKQRGRQKELAAAFTLAFILFISPFCALTSALFSARVAHHVALTAVLAPILAFAIPKERLPKVGSIAAWTGVQALIFWLWHWPGFYATALSSHLVYWLMQLSLLGASLPFWIAARNAPPPAAVGALLVTMVQMGLLGALITFAPSPIYEPHAMTTGPWGLSALQDQQLAGLIMWVPAAGFYLAAALIVTSRWLRIEQRLAA